MPEEPQQLMVRQDNAALAELSEAITAHPGIALGVQEYLRREVPMIRRIFPSKLDRLVRDGALRAAKTELEAKQRVFQLVVEANIETIREQLNDMVKRVKVAYRGQFTTFVQGEHERLRKSLDGKMKEYLKDSKERLVVYEEYKGTPAGEAYYQAIIEQDRTYFAWTNKLLNDFKGIVDEKIREYSS